MVSNANLFIAEKWNLQYPVPQILFDSPWWCNGIEPYHLYWYMAKSNYRWIENEHNIFLRQARNPSRRQINYDIVPKGNGTWIQNLPEL